MPLLLRRYRLVLGFFIVALVASGVTAFPLNWELNLLTRWRGVEQLSAAQVPEGLDHWLLTVRDGLRETEARYPWYAYGTDWLAFAHIIIAVFFIGALIDPVRNVWVLYAGLVACFLIWPHAFICGPIRGIPFYWRLIDCSFGIFGALPLLYCLKLTKQIARTQSYASAPASR
jgi:hypothetical protein